MKMGKGIPGRGNSTHQSCGASNPGHVQGAVGTQVWLGPAGHGGGGGGADRPEEQLGQVADTTGLEVGHPTWE